MYWVRTTPPSRDADDNRIGLRLGFERCYEGSTLHSMGRYLAELLRLALTPPSAGSEVIQSAQDGIREPDSVATFRIGDHQDPSLDECV
jgi:hypothetical protein